MNGKLNFPHLFLLLGIILTAAASPAATLEGQVNSDINEPLPGATVMIVGTTTGAAADIDGNFRIENLEPGRYDVRITMIGYQTQEKTVDLTKSDGQMSVRLTVDPVSLQGVEVTTESERSYMDREAAVRTEVITGSELEDNSSDGGLLSALGSEAGLTTKPCALCGSAGIGMQGLDPSYTEINVDGMPVLSGLGTLYGLDGVAVQDVSKVEITKGSGSTLFGAGAIAGAVNLVSAEPRRDRSFGLKLSGNHLGRHTVSGYTAGLTGGLPMRLSVTYSGEPQDVDTDHDGVTDTPRYSRINVQYGTETSVSGGSLKLGARYYGEDRFAGDTRWTHDDRGSADIYGRDIHTTRQEISARYQSRSAGGWSWGLESALINHDQDSYYGVTFYDANQQLALGKFSLNREWNALNSSLLQLTYNYTDYEDNLQLASPTDQLYRVPGAVFQHTWRPAVQWEVQAGGRIENYEDDGVVAVPRGSIRWSPDEATGVRLSGGGGYRPVSIFSLDKAVHAGFENVVVPEELEPERSWAGSFAVNRQWAGRVMGVMLDLSLFYTQFDNKVILAYGSELGQTTYTNSDEAYSTGAELQASWTHISGWSLDLSGRRSEIMYKNEQGWNHAHLQHLYTGNAALARSWSNPGFKVELIADFFGPQYLPEGRVSGKTPAYSIWELGFSKDWNQITLAAVVKNLFDWTQPDSPYLRDPATGRLLLDSSLFYGPLLGRTFHISLGYRFGSQG